MDANVCCSKHESILGLYALGEGWRADQSHEQQCQALAHSPFSAASLGMFGAKSFAQGPIFAMERIKNTLASV
ncbi:MAG TPA: hypothetical protein VNC42_14860 [Bradyrhizobium sp.]|jgi:hypothetical protein|nr:hypothetical protein [Bradyrhizobium sp.]